MIVQKILIVALTAALGAAAIAQTSPELFQLSVKDVPVENGKRLEMTFREIDRQAEFSTAEITFVSGGSVSSSMFILRGTCGMARARGEQYFHTVQVSKAPTRFRVTFPKAASPAELRPANPADKVFSLAECALVNF